MNCLLSYDAPAVLTELLTLRSDDHRSKRQVVNDIYENGKANMPQNVGRGTTSTLMNVFIRGMGLDMS